MKNWIDKGRAISLLVLVLAASSVGAAPNLQEYQLVFSDEFNGGALNTNKWSTAPIWGPFPRTNQEEQFYVDEAGITPSVNYSPFQFTGDALKIVAEPVSTAGPAPGQPAEGASIWNNYPEYQYNSGYTIADRNYLSGIITSVDSFNFTRGYTEIRAKVPSGKGLWPAFWLLTTKYVENAPEIDIMEYIGQRPNEINHSMHYFDIDNNWSLISTNTYVTTGPDYSLDYHTYGLSWGPDEVIWYIDGVETKRVDSSEFLISTQSMYLILNLAVGGTWPTSPDENTVFPAEFEIDYVKTYQKKPPSTISAATLASDYQLVFSDEFSGGNVNAAKWTSSYLWGPYLRINEEKQVYIDALGRHSNYPVNPFSVGGGKLTITADSASDYPAQPAATNAEWSLYSTHQFDSSYGSTWIPEFTSGVLTSYESFKFVNGYVEIKAKVPDGGGLWPALWLLNGYYVGAQPEIDILEIDGANPTISHHSYHYYNSIGEIVSSPQTKTNSVNLADDFHTYGVSWRPGKIIWYIDRKPVRTLTDSAVSTQLMYVILNLAVGGGFVGEVTASFPKKLEIDYVRAYQLKGPADSGGGSSTDGSTTAGSTTDGSTTDGSTTAGSTTDGGTSGGVLKIEGESGSLNGNMASSVDSAASGGSYVSVPGSGSSSALVDYVELAFSVDKTGTYEMTGRVRGPTSGSNSFFVEVGQSDTWKWHFPKTGTSYVSDKVSHGGSDVRVYLNSGTNLVRVYRREAGSRLDWLELSYIGADASGDVDGDGAANSVDGFPNDSSQSSGGSTTSGSTTSGSTTSGSTTSGSTTSGSTTSGSTTSGSTTSGSTTSGSTTSGSTTSGSTTSGSTTSGGLRAEGEAGSLTGNMSSSSDAAASGGSYVSVPGTGSSSALLDYVELTFNIDQTGSYEMTGRVRGPSSTSNSFFVEAGESDTWKWHFSPSGDSYKEDQVRHAGSIVRLYLTAGTAKIRVYRRESGSRLDWLELDFKGADASGDADGDGVANSADGFPNDSEQSAGGSTTSGSTTSGSTTSGSTTSGSTTSGSTTSGSTTSGTTTSGSTTDGSTTSGSTTDGSTSGGLKAEGESGSLTGRMTAASDSAASGGSYVSVPGSGSSSALEDFVELTFNVSQTGTYELLGRVNGPTAKSNSFFIESGNSDTWLWHFSTTGSSYIERHATHQNSRIRVYLTAGTSKVRVYRRESGARLDWLELQYVGPDALGDLDADGVANNADSTPNNSVSN